ncbi:hypothetical protein BFU36_10875 [Sulfolobus sp. A20]|uniref:hypothetical protein n=1 Tax=Saccharolobus sp. A20 TaxID=1891280 RepID=UPI0008460A34|nr:hypothetical protein [Sulfolobus sp. A20]TRM74780.1 hypothetical protein DJ528_10035 [Sulfolobus sp. B5]TRM75860.1 hypothetical protein DJ523_02135 [Sulfolobus sp. E5]TRM78392.1 hypothetical protein DJ532_01145 [Sulfolobus sp. A20-N-F8]TRM83647.1 hypothetical protein DJ531_04470 [Sulfolobus sp. A20-N-F6]TRM86455.1 hypothetical protein DJ521_05515 [Sulfolobus sp. E3]TRM89100.1 hypothetical protein DJ529_03275 [Sulfolobus sp. C3]TRN02634.1 hypothetical protein DJ530_03960 [Sulfolobus sp. E1
MVDEIEIMSLGYYASQKKTLILGRYVLKFHRRKNSKKNMYFYIVNLYHDDKLVRSGIFTEYRNAVIFAGSIIYKLL